MTALAATGLAAAWLLTGAVRRYALARAVLDVPNHRSAHTVPTPRGGGLAIGCVALLGIAALGALGALPAGTAAALVGGGALVAGVGWIDDHRGVGAELRIVVHFLAAGWALAWLGGVPEVSLGTATLPLGPAGWVLGAVGIVWLTNLYNFMDGIDGIAAGEAVVVGGAGGVLLLLAEDAGLAGVALLLAAASGGFLLWNWAPARIFMGDVGSGLLGYLFAVLALASENAGALPLLGWVLLLGVFVLDATLTLVRRVARGERWYDAHASHAYQRAVRSGWTHARVTGTVLLLDLLLALLALLALLRPAALPGAVGCGLLVLGAAYLAVERRCAM